MHSGTTMTTVHLAYGRDGLLHDRRGAGEQCRQPGTRPAPPMRRCDGDERLGTRLVVEEVAAAAVDLQIDERGRCDAVAPPARRAIGERLGPVGPGRDSPILDAQRHAAAHLLAIEEQRWP